MCDLCLYAHLLQLAGEDLAQVRDQRLPIVALAGDPLHDVLVGLRLEVAESKVFQLPFHLTDAQAVSQRGVDVQRLVRDLPALDLRERVERAHVVEAVGKLDEDDPEVLRHGDHHLPDVLGLLLLVGTQSDPAELRDPVNEPSNLGPELALDLLRGEGGVLHGVVQQRGRDRLGVKLQVGQDGGDLERVIHVLLAGQAVLARVGVRGALVRLSDHLLILRIEVVGNSEKL